MTDTNTDTHLSQNSNATMNLKPNLEQPVTAQQFVDALIRRSPIQVSGTDFLTYGYRAGWLEEQDVSRACMSIERKSVARIIHEFLTWELHEPDIPSVTAAVKLQDLYDCRVCVRHVMQVYEKGIMDAGLSSDGRLIFGMNEYLSTQELNRILEHLFDSRLRNPPATGSNSMPAVIRLSTDEALHYCRTEKQALIIDVRSPSEYHILHLENAISLPLMSILKNPYAVSERHDRMLLLYCSDAYQSDMAARCLMESGYEKVYSFAWKPAITNK